MYAVVIRRPTTENARRFSTDGSSSVKTSTRTQRFHGAAHTAFSRQPYTAFKIFLPIFYILSNIVIYFYFSKQFVIVFNSC